MIIHHDHPIGELFTWHVQATARYCATAYTIDDLRAIYASQEYQASPRHYVLGKGANTLFASHYYDGFVIHNSITGREIVSEDEASMTWRIGAGEDWHETIKTLVYEHGLGGMENLAYIPGTFGAAPIQNVAAYGQALEDVFVELEALEIATSEMRVFTRSDAQFRYRDSYFKSSDFRDRYIITSVTVRLARAHTHQIESGYHSKYESLRGELVHLYGEHTDYSLTQVFEAVTSLRQKKLPEVTDVGTNGSTFMNPIVSGEKLLELLQKFPSLQYYPVEKMSYPQNTKYQISNTKPYKIAAGHVFDELGWKGRVIDGVGTWRNHALVVCNYSATSAEAITKYIAAMRADFAQATGIDIVPEINIVGSSPVS